MVVECLEEEGRGLLPCVVSLGAFQFSVCECVCVCVTELLLTKMIRGGGRSLNGVCGSGFSFFASTKVS